MTPEEIIRTILSADGVYSKAELILLIDNMTQDEFNTFCNAIRSR
jgi:hypothetical protein